MSEGGLVSGRFSRPSCYRKKPVVIEAIRYLPHENCAAVSTFIGEPDHSHGVCAYMDSSAPWIIHTLEGDMAAQAGDWIVRHHQAVRWRDWWQGSMIKSIKTGLIESLSTEGLRQRIGGWFPRQSCRRETRARKYSWNGRSESLVIRDC